MILIRYLCAIQRGLHLPTALHPISAYQTIKKILYLTIHPEARFSNQQQIIADDVIASLEQAINRGPIEHNHLLKLFILSTES